jgi:hypothetical protein
MWRNCGPNYRTAGYASTKTIERSSPRVIKAFLPIGKVDRLAATSVPGAVQSTSSIEYWHARQKDLLETLKEKLSAVTAALSREQKLLANRLSAVNGGMKQVDAVLDSLCPSGKPA